MLDYKKIVKNRELRIKIVNLLRFIPTSLYLQIVFFVKNGKFLHFRHPRTFCEKMNWLKLHDIRPEYTDMVDKSKVGKIVKDILEEDISFPVLGCWDKYNDIEFSKLPQQFVLKCTHDSGSVRVIHDKSKMNHEELRNFYEGRLKVNPYVLGREYPYRNVPPKIIAEKYMTPEGHDDIEDYKFFCFNGKPEILFVATERSSNCKFDFYDMEFKHLDIVNIHPQSGKTIEKPSCFEEMKEIAAKLSKGMKFVRIDLYEISGKVYFGEFTFFHGGGFWPMKPEAWESKLGDMIELDS